MKNLVGIQDKVIVRLKGEGKECVMGNGETVTITQISEMDNTIYYSGYYNYTCPVTKTECEGSIQFKEGEYEVAEVSGSIEE